ncbi:MAG TPA: porin, partial [Isosphaeraceae bacterium]|nr:porin [Isosphaeraceae bacterium]
MPPAPPAPPSSTGVIDEPPPLPGAPVPAPPSREAELEARVRQLEAMVRELSNRVDRVQVPSTPANPSRTVPGAAGEAREEVQGSANKGPSAPAPSPRFEMPAPTPNFPLKNLKFGPGFSFSTEDDEYQFQFHDLTQVDYRGIWDTPKVPLTTGDQSTFGIPRQWWIFSGRVKKPFEYFLVPSFGFNSVNLLDAFLNIHFDDRLQFKIGRYKTPFTYEFYNSPANGLINPERSLFFNNFGLNRDIGMMAWGQLFQKRLDSAAGIFNGTR